MSTPYSFPCTPCGFSHAGECDVLSCGCKGKCKGHTTQEPPPSSNWVKTVPAGGDEITISVGSRWRLQHQYPVGSRWLPIGHQDGYEVMAIVASGFSVAIQMREYGAPQYPVYTCSLQWWDPQGNGASDGGRNRFVPWT